MTPTEEKALTVYKASAGSGKTFTLSVEYIKLLIKNPMSFRSTLAVTFTNKATEEMKTRILSQLYGIWKQLPKSKDYIEKIKSELGVTEQFMSDRAKIALFNIVHNYSYFRIETIDSFFQSVLRNLARELDLTANLRIELNDRQIESIAVDEMIDELGEKDELLKWILGYIKENIDDDKNWNVIGYIKSFGENIFREFSKRKALTSPTSATASRDLPATSSNCRTDNTTRASSRAECRRRSTKPLPTAGRRRVRRNRCATSPRRPSCHCSKRQNLRARATGRCTHRRCSR